MKQCISLCRILGLCLLQNELCPITLNRHVIKVLLGRKVSRKYALKKMHLLHNAWFLNNSIANYSFTAGELARLCVLWPGYVWEPAAANPPFTGWWSRSSVCCHGFGFRHWSLQRGRSWTGNGLRCLSVKLEQYQMSLVLLRWKNSAGKCVCDARWKTRQHIWKFSSS